MVADGVLDAGAQPGAERTRGVTTTLPGFVVSSVTATTVRPPKVLGGAPGRRTVTESTPADAGRRRASARSFPYSACSPANDTVTEGRTASAKGGEDA